MAIKYCEHCFGNGYFFNTDPKDVSSMKKTQCKKCKGTGKEK